MANHERVGRLQNAANKVAMEAYLQGISQGKCEVLGPMIFDPSDPDCENEEILQYYTSILIGASGKC
jgi:hypothetical protein